MYDIHNDLLTNLYFNFKIDNKFQNIELLLSGLRVVYKTGNIQGGIVNFLFISQEEMYKKFGIKRYELEDTKKMLKEAINFLEELKLLEIIDENADFLYSIERCYYLTIEDLESFKKLGLSAILPVSNNKNRFGSGYNDEEIGLTEEGKKLIEKAIELHLLIDVANCNEKTFNDILDIIEAKKQEGEEVFLIASHTNAKDLCQSKRNFTKAQLERLRKNDAYIGINSNSKVLTEKENPTKEEKEQEIINQINYMLEQIKFTEDKILIATDDMNYHQDYRYHNTETYPLRTFKSGISNLLIHEYGEVFTKKVLVKNAKQLFERLKSNEKIITKKIV